MVFQHTESIYESFKEKKNFASEHNLDNLCKGLK